MDAVAAQQAVLRATYLSPRLPTGDSAAALALCCLATMSVCRVSSFAHADSLFLVAIAGLAVRLIMRGRYGRSVAPMRIARAPSIGPSQACATPLTA